MDQPGLDTIRNELKGIEQALMPELQKQAEEIKKHGETSAATSKAIKELEAKYDARMKDLDEALTEIKQDVATKTALKAGRGAGLASVGAVFIDSDEYKAATESQPATGAVQVKSFFSGRKALFTDASLGTIDAHLYEARREPGIVELPAPDLHIRDLLPVTPISEGLVHYIERSNGRWVAEVQESEGDQKKEQAL